MLLQWSLFTSNMVGASNKEVSVRRSQKLRRTALEPVKANQKEVGLKEELKQLPSDTGLTKGQQISIILNSISCKAKKNKAGNNLNTPTLNISEKNLLLLIPPHLFGIC